MCRGDADRRSYDEHARRKDYRMQGNKDVDPSALHVFLKHAR